MRQYINFSQFCDGFTGSYADKFSYSGKRALFDYLEGYEEDTGQDIEFDPVALCCEFTEYADLEELQQNYTDIESMEELEEHTTVIPIPGSDSFIIADY